MFQMDDKTQNVICHVDIKEEYSEDFKDIENQNFLFNQKDNVTNKINFIQCEKQVDFYCLLHSPC